MATGKELATINNQALVPVMDDELREILRDNLGSGEFNIFNLPRIRVPAGGGIAWNVDTINGPAAETTIDGVVVHWKTWRAYWPGEFTGQGTPPQCSSVDGITGSGDPGGSCAQCPMNQFGTKGRGKACKEMRAVFILREGSIMPDLMVLPVTSAKVLAQQFVKMASRRLSYWRIPMRFRLTTDKNADGIPFAIVSPEALQDNQFSDEEIANLRAYRESILPALDQQAVVYVQSGELDTDELNG